MKRYFFEIKRRLKSPRAIILLFAYTTLIIKKIFKVDFKEDQNPTKISIDLVIPTIAKDYELLEKMLAGARENVRHTLNKCFIVSPSTDEVRNFCLKNNCVFVDEKSVVGYTKASISYTVKGVDRSGWIFQQILKLSGEKFTEMENYLVIDSDTILINPHIFIKANKFVFFQNEEWHQPYFSAFKKMFGYDTKNNLSYTSHMMIFNKNKLKQMKKELDEKHEMAWDKVYLKTIDQNENSCVSDYDTYVNWMVCNFPELVINRPLYNRSLGRKYLESLENLKKRFGSKFKSLSFHSYLN